MHRPRLLTPCVLPLTLWLTLRAVAARAGPATSSHERSGQSAFNLPVWPFRARVRGRLRLLALQVFAEMIKLARQVRTPPVAEPPADRERVMEYLPFWMLPVAFVLMFLGVPGGLLR